MLICKIRSFLKKLKHKLSESTFKLKWKLQGHFEQKFNNKSETLKKQVCSFVKRHCDSRANNWRARIFCLFSNSWLATSNIGCHIFALHAAALLSATPRATFPLELLLTTHSTTQTNAVQKSLLLNIYKLLQVFISSRL